MYPYRPRLETSSVVIWRAICQSWEARRTRVQESWRVDQRETETRKGSCAVRRQRGEGRKQEGDMEVGVGVMRVRVEKSDLWRLDFRWSG
jgi:hypothetical protein